MLSSTSQSCDANRHILLVDEAEFRLGFVSRHDEHMVQEGKQIWKILAFCEEFDFQNNEISSFKVIDPLYCIVYYSNWRSSHLWINGKRRLQSILSETSEESRSQAWSVMALWWVFLTFCAKRVAYSSTNLV